MFCFSRGRSVCIFLPAPIEKIKDGLKDVSIEALGGPSVKLRSPDVGEKGREWIVITTPIVKYFDPHSQILRGRRSEQLRSHQH